MIKPKGILILFIVVGLGFSQGQDSVTYVAYTSENSEIPNDLSLKQGTGGGGYCYCRTTYDSRSVHRGCHSCPLNCYKYRKVSPYNTFGCKTCPYGCSSCTNGSSCSYCKPGFYLSGELCYKCQVSGCTSCSGPGLNCRGCLSARFFDGRICDTCMANCATCSSKTSCSSCMGARFFDGRKCDDCLANCSSCTSKTSCTKCNKEYFFDSQKIICDHCVPHCHSCKNKQSCDNCYSFYEWKDDLKQCKEMPMWKKFLIWVGIIFFVGICVCCVCFFSLFSNGRRYGRRRNYRYDDDYSYDRYGSFSGGFNGGFNGNFSDGNEHNVGYDGEY